jgi:predicted HTH domain antitoxin
VIRFAPANRPVPALSASLSPDIPVLRFALRAAFGRLPGQRPLARAQHFSLSNLPLLDIRSGAGDFSRVSTTSTPQSFSASLPEDFGLAVRLTDSELDHHLRLMAALKMFELGQISSGKAAQLAGISRVDFLQTCGRYRISIFNYPPEELEKELRSDLARFGEASTR